MATLPMATPVRVAKSAPAPTASSDSLPAMRPSHSSSTSIIL